MHLRLARPHPVLDPGLFSNRLLRGGLVSFFFQYLVQNGVFSVVPLFLSVSLGLSAVDTGLRILPLSLALLVAAVGIPKVFPHASPQRVLRVGFALLFVGIVVLVASLEVGVGAEVVTWPMLLTGLGIGALASQLGSVTVSAVPDEQSAEAGPATAGETTRRAPMTPWMGLMTPPCRGRTLAAASRQLIDRPDLGISG